MSTIEIEKVEKKQDAPPRMWHFGDELRPTHALCGHVLTGEPLQETESIDEIDCIVCVDVWLS